MTRKLTGSSCIVNFSLSHSQSPAHVSFRFPQAFLIIDGLQITTTWYPDV
jgi:hypothetical protein